MIVNIYKKNEKKCFEWVVTTTVNNVTKFLKTLGEGYYIVKYGNITENYFWVKEDTRIIRLNNKFWVSWKDKMPIFTGTYKECEIFKEKMEWDEDYIITDTPLITLYK